MLDTNGLAQNALPVYAFDGSTYTGYNGTTNVSGQVTLTLPLGNYRFRADKSGQQYFSGLANHCSIPGCITATITLPVTGGFMGGVKVLAALSLRSTSLSPNLSAGLQQSGTVTTTVIRYTYDPLGRLTEATYSTGESFAYAYDEVGNRTAQTATITSTQVANYVYDAANRLANVNGQAYAWDNNGNLINDGGTVYAYNQANRLISVTLGMTTTQYAYNGEGARLKQIVNGKPMTYTLDLVAPLVQVLVQKDSSGDTRYLYGLMRIGEQQSVGRVYHLSDALGSVRQLVDGSGQVALARGYTPYGEALWSQGSGQSVYGYTGEDFDVSTGLVFLRARYMDPELGSFLSRDPWSGDDMQPGSMNGFGYVEGNPVNELDPSGQWELKFSSQKVYVVAEEGDDWDSYLAGFFGKEVSMASLSPWLPLDRWPPPPRTGTKVNITSALDPLIAKVAELGGEMEQRYYPPNVDPFNCYPTALTCAAGKCQYHEYPYYDIDDFLRDNSLNIEHEADLRYGDIFRIGGDDGGTRPDGRPAFYNAPIHYGMILWRSGTTDKIWTFNGQITSYAFIAQLPDVLAYYRTEYPERNIIGVPKLDDPRGDLGPMHSKGYYRLNLSVSAAQIAQWIDEHKKLNSSK